ncbi:signal peptide peptidase SppA [Calidifontibacillus oryziterrae]|uniref:signal peptide peptidase SppA n=1 Tax=Calidifontibacillus oryziterrae TaxID=1191699 RepID=UPI0002E691B8|nr:signal peptide peptidase SppA [Calidifontibacillus oryziterrae]
MNGKRWLALGIAVILFFFSLGVNFLTSLAFNNEDDWRFSWMEEMNKEFTETIIEEGSEFGSIVVLDVNGVIQDTGEIGAFFESPTYNHRKFLKMLQNAGEDDSVKGIIIRVNSPGGGVSESAELHDRIVDIQENYSKPIYISMGSMAASGGYYISAPADKIFASPETLTGSLGVIMQGINYAQLAEKYGVKFETIKSGEHKDIMSPTREITDEERRILQEMVDNSYEGFVDVIVNGRNMSPDKVREIADGRIYDGRQAKELGLIDEFGYLDETIAAMKDLEEVGDVSVVRYGVSFGFDSLFSSMSQHLFVGDLDFELTNISNMLSQPNSPRLMYLYAR